MRNNLDTIRAGYENFAKGNIPAVLTTFDPKIEWTEPAGSIYPGTFVGHEEVVEKVFMRIGTDWESFGVTPNEFIEQGDTVVALGELTGKHKTNGKEFKVRFAHVWKFKNGVAASLVNYLDTKIISDTIT